MCFPLQQALDNQALGDCSREHILIIPANMSWAPVTPPAAARAATAAIAAASAATSATAAASDPWPPIGGQQLHCSAILTGRQNSSVWVDLGYTQGLFTLPDYASNGVLEIRGVNMRGLPQGRQEAGVSGDMAVVRMWTHLLWSISRCAAYSGLSAYTCAPYAKRLHETYTA